MRSVTDRRRPLAIRVLPALACAVAVLALALIFREQVSRKMPDLEVYWRAAVRARAAQPLYRPEDGHYQFKYLPGFAVLMAPAGSLSLAAAKVAWFSVSVLLLVALVGLSLQVLPERRRPLWLLVTATVVAMLKFFGHELVLGQMNALFAVIVVLAVVALRRRHEAAAGALIALAVAVKPYALIFLPWLIARRRAPSIAAASVGIAMLVAIPAFVYGFAGDVELHRSWWRTVAASTAPNLTNPDNVSLAAMYAKWIGPGRVAASFAAASGAALLGAAVLIFLRRRGVAFPEGLEAAVLLTSIPLLSPQGWDYVFLVSTPAILYVVNYEDRLPPALRVLALASIATIGLSIYDVMGRAAYSAFMAASAISICYVVVIAALCSLRLRAVA
jgi:hypothetical protein